MKTDEECHPERTREGSSTETSSKILREYAQDDRCARATWWRVTAIVALTFVGYLPAIRGGFIWDDDVHVTENAALQTMQGLKLIWTLPGATPQYYPLTHTSFWIEHHLWDRNPQEHNPRGYHVDNVLLHIANALLLWRILAMLEFRGAFLAAAIFAMHPVHVESVAWVTERKNLLCGLFYFLAGWSLLRALRDRFQWKWYALGLVAFVAAELSKTVAGSLPAALLLVLWWRDGRVTRRPILATLPMFAFAIAMGRVTASMERTVVGAVGPEWDYSIAQRVLIAGRAVWFYAYKLLLPIDLSFVYPKWLLDNPSLWLFPVALVLLIVALWPCRKKLGRGPITGVLFFVGTLVPALGFVNVYPMRYSFVADHFQYLASIGVIAMIAWALAPWERWAVAIPIVLAVLTWRRAEVFSSGQLLWEDTLEKNPDAWIAHDQLGILLRQKHDYEEAAGHFSEATRINPNHIEGHIELGKLLLEVGDAKGAVKEMQKAVEVRPDKPLAHYQLGRALAAVGDSDGAIAAYQQALIIEPKFVWARLALADLYARLGEPDKSDEQKREAQRLLREALGYDARP